MLDFVRTLRRRRIENRFEAFRRSGSYYDDYERWQIARVMRGHGALGIEVLAERLLLTDDRRSVKSVLCSSHLAAEAVLVTLGEPMIETLLQSGEFSARATQADWQEFTGVLKRVGVLAIPKLIGVLRQWHDFDPKDDDPLQNGIERALKCLMEFGAEPVDQLIEGAVKNDWKRFPWTKPKDWEIAGCLDSPWAAEKLPTLGQDKSLAFAAWALKRLSVETTVERRAEQKFFEVVSNVLVERRVFLVNRRGRKAAITFLEQVGDAALQCLAEMGADTVRARA